MPEPSLFELSRNGGCGCKASPAQLHTLLGGIAKVASPKSERLVVGNSSADDCAAWVLDDDQVVVSTTDFFMPVVNDPLLFGKIVATNAISDIYAMGANPLFALAILGMPMAQMSSATITQIMTGGKMVCAQAGIDIGGGHTIDCAEPIYGLAVNGLCTLARLCRNDSAKSGDMIILTKPLGIGVLSNALRKDTLNQEGYAELIKHTTQLNKPGPVLAAQGKVSAMTDVTGFGLLGHTLEMARGAKLHIKLQWEQIPILEHASLLAAQGCVTGASSRNWNAYGSAVRFNRSEPVQIDLLTDPQTSGGLLIACAEENVAEIISYLHNEGFAHANCIGHFVEGEPGVEVSAG